MTEKTGWESEEKMFLYRITNNKNNMTYIGIVVKSGKTIYDRLEEHVNGKGSVWIRKAIESGDANPSDFTTELVRDDFSCLKDLRDAENKYILNEKTLWPNGYNGNIGNYIVVTPEARQRGIEKRLERIRSGDLVIVGQKGFACYRQQNGKNVRLRITDPRVLSGEVVHVNYRGGDVKAEGEKLRKDEERKKNGGFTDKQIAAFAMTGDNLKNEVVGGRQWRQGREKYRARMKNKDYTEREIGAYAKRSDNVTEIWVRRSPDKRRKVASNGLFAMNSTRLTCTYCGMITTKGNIKRWHNENCKHKPVY